jgi:branched-chain amino acid transport system ATP-binding protein
LPIEEREVVTLLGRNGTGKATTVRSIMGLLKPSAGEIRFGDRDVRGAVPGSVAGLGVGLVPEGRQAFPTLSVRENPIATSANHLASKEPLTPERVYAFFPRLRERAKSAATLSGGEHQMLGALMTNPRLLILDEATEGLAPLIRCEIWRCIEALKAQGLSILLIYKNIEVMKLVADRHYTLEKGRTVWAGSSADLVDNAELVHRFVGI